MPNRAATIPKLYWHEMHGQKFVRNLNPYMLSREVKLLTSCRRNSFGQPHVHEVVYDREYVLAYIGNRIIKLLELQDNKELALALMDEAFEYMHSGEYGVNGN